MLAHLWLALAGAGLGALARGAEAALALTWVSQPALPSETVILVGAGFDNNTKLTLKSATGKVASASPLPGQISGDGLSLKFSLPADLAAWTVTAASADGKEVSNEIQLNYPALQWAQGDGGEFATPGGYVRIFGKCLSFEADHVEGLRARHRALQANALEVADSDPQAAEAAMQALVSLRRQIRQALGAALPTLRLTPHGFSEDGGSYDITATNASGLAAFFELPQTLPPGEYNVSVANSLAPNNFIGLDTFISPKRPRVSTIAVRDPSPYPSFTVRVTDFDPSIGSVPTEANPEHWVNSMPAFRKALAAAERTGGGTVYFPRGQYFFNDTEGVTVPWNVMIKGEARDLVSLYWAAVPDVTGAPLAYLRSPGTTGIDRSPSGSGRWGMEDLTMYIIGFHNHIIFLNNQTDGFSLYRTRIFANAFFGNNGPESRPGRFTNFSLTATGPLIGVQNCKNWAIMDNDLFSDGVVLTSVTRRGQLCQSYWPSSCHGASWGMVARNKMWNGMGAHWMNQWQQVIFEHNDILGISPIAMGNPVGTGPGGGYSQNIYHGQNSIKFVHGNDRELITTDDAGGAYLGTLAAVSGTELTLEYDSKSCGSWEWGGWEGAAVVVLNGTGLGQWRRVAVPGIGVEDFNERNRTWIMDRPFDVEPAKDAVVQIVPYRGNFIFDGDTFMDGGTVQLYGQALDVMVANCVGERMSGFLAWGQWRTCSLFQYCQKPGQLQGEFGNGVMPNVGVQFINNTITEGNKIVRWFSHAGDGNPSFGLDKFLSGATFAVAGLDDDPTMLPTLAISMFAVFRNNKVHSNGGFLIGWGGGQGIRDVLIEGNQIRHTNASFAVQVDPRAEHVLVINNELPTDQKATLHV